MRTRYAIDTEFDEGVGISRTGAIPTIGLISIALVCDDGREYYAISNEFDAAHCNDWVRVHVLSKLPPRTDPLWKSRAQIAAEIIAFVKAGALVPEFWGYYADYDWVVFCWLFGRMVDLPPGFPKHCCDLKQLMDSYNNLRKTDLPEQAGDEHNALDDARWVMSGLLWIERWCRGRLRGFPKQYFYQVRGKGSEWMRAWITSDGCISIVSDYGNYGSWFGAPGGELRRFLLRADTDYLGNKLADGQRDYKGEESLRRVKEHILEQRRHREWSRDGARQEWDLLAGFDWLDREGDFIRWTMETQIEAALVGEFYCTGIPSQLKWFLKNLWPFFVEKLQAEIDAEDAASVASRDPLEMGT